MGAERFRTMLATNATKNFIFFYEGYTEGDKLC